MMPAAPSHKRLALERGDAEALQLYSHESVSCAAPMKPDQLLPTIASILQELCEVNDQAPSPVISKFHAARNPGISILDYLTRVCQYADCSDTCFVLALIYIDRVQAHPNFQVCTLNVHRLIITSVMLAAKFFDDHYFNNAFYARIGGVSKEEMNQLELEYLFMVGFTLTVTEREYTAYDTELRAHCGRLAERQRALERQRVVEQQQQEQLLLEQRRQQEILALQQQQQQQAAAQQQQQQHHMHPQFHAQQHYGGQVQPHQQHHDGGAADPWISSATSAAAPVQGSHWKAAAEPLAAPAADGGDFGMTSCSPTTGFGRSASGSYSSNLVTA